MTDGGDFYLRYADALGVYLRTGDETSLTVAHELGRRALSDRMSVLEIVENHAHFVEDLERQGSADRAAGLQFLLQTLASVDVATRGFLENTERYEEQRARAEDLADRDEFRSALVNSLQEGFFVADGDGTVVEVNDAFTEITGYGEDGLPYPMPHPWVVDEEAAADRRGSLVHEGNLTAEIKIRHRDGRVRWVGISVKAVTTRQSARGFYVGTMRDITATHAATERDRAIARLASAVTVARSVEEVLTITLAQCRESLDADRLMAIMWPKTGGDPIVHVAGEPPVASWDDLDPDWRRTVEDARGWIPLTVTAVGAAPSAGTTRGLVSVLSGARDVVLCLEHRTPRVVSPEDRHLMTALVGHLSLAMQHVRQFETARETSLTLQRSMLAPLELPAGSAVRYEPAVPPLEIGGDFYDVLPVDDHRIGIIVGDCVGRGLSAAAVMGQLRASARALLLTGAEPATLLEQLDSVAKWIPDAFCTTVFAALVDTESATLQYSSAGHVPPVLVSGSSPQLLTDAASVPLAVRRHDSRPQATRPLTPGSTLMVYTDGLVERRDEAIDNQIDRVAAVVADTVKLPIEDVADAVLGKLAPDQGYDDDVAIVLYRAPQAFLVIDDEAIASRLTAIRHRLAGWLADNGVPGPQASDMVLVVNEACSNSVEHAYRGREPGRVRVEAEIRDNRVDVNVTDFGSWKPPADDPGTRGRGLLLMRAVSHQVDLDGTAGGTTVTITFQLPEVAI